VLPRIFYGDQCRRGHEHPNERPSHHLNAGASAAILLARNRDLGPG
jgi:hypothetical protein